MSTESVINLRLNFVSNVKKGITEAANAISSILGGATKQAEKGSDALFKSMMKFETIKKIFQELGKVGKAVFEEALAQSPKLAQQFEGIKDKIGVLVTDLARVFTPMIEQFFNFFERNWVSIRAVVQGTGSVIKGTIYSLMAAFQLCASASIGLASAIIKPFEMIGLVAKGTSDSWSEASHNMAIASKDSFDKIIEAGEEMTAKHVETRSKTMAWDKKRTEEAKKAEDKRIAASIKHVNYLFDVEEKNAKETLDLEEFINEELFRLDIEKDQKAQQSRQLQRDLEDENYATRLEMFEAYGKEFTVLGITFEENSFNELRNSFENKILILERQRDRELELFEGTEQQKALLKRKFDHQIVTMEKTKNKAVAQMSGQVGMAVASESAGILNTLAQMVTSGNKITRDERIAYKGLMMSSAIISGAAGAARALADYPYPYSLIVAGLVGVQTALQVGMISQQKFAKGGIVGGGQQSITVNEEGPEAVLNARATRRLGRAGVDRLNNGGNDIGGGVSINAPIIINGSGLSERELTRVLKNASDENLRALKGALDDIGYKNIKR